MMTGGNSNSSTDRWNGQADARGAVRMQSRFLDPDILEPLYEPTHIDEYESSSFSNSTIPDDCWNYVRNGASAGRGSLLNTNNQLDVHKNDRELNKQLRLAMGLGYSTDNIEDSFNSHDDRERFADCDVEDNLPTDAHTLLPDAVDDCHEEQREEAVEPVEEAVAGCESIVWEERTSPPEVPSNLLIRKSCKNVAIQSLNRMKQKDKNVEVPIAETPTAPLQNQVKEDWRAEARAEQEAKLQLATGMADQQTSDEAPLLGNLVIDAGNDWTMWGPHQVTQVPDLSNPVVPEPVQVQQKSVIPQTDALLVQGLASNSSHRKKKKNKKFCPIMEFPEPPPRSVQPNIAPPDFRFQTNGVLPSVRNSDHNATLGTGNLHSTFGNMFQNALGKKPRGNNRGNFNLNNDDFPTL